MLNRFGPGRSVPTRVTWTCLRQECWRVGRSGVGRWGQRAKSDRWGREGRSMKVGDAKAQGSEAPRADPAGDRGLVRRGLACRGAGCGGGLRRALRRGPGAKVAEPAAGGRQPGAVLPRLCGAAFGQDADAAVLGGAPDAGRALRPPAACHGTGRVPCRARLAGGRAGGAGGLCPQRVRPRAHVAQRRHAGRGCAAGELQPGQHGPAGAEAEPWGVGGHRAARCAGWRRGRASFLS